MRKSILRITFSVLLWGLLSASASASVNIGIHGGFKFATDTLYKEIYGSSNPSFGVSAGIDLFWRFQLIGEYNYLSDKGAMTISGEEEAGTYIELNDNWRLDLNLRYVKAEIEPFIERIDLGGIKIGVEIGYKF